MKNQTLEQLVEAAKEVYSSEGDAGRKSLERTFGVGTFKSRPIGVWCLSTNGSRFRADEWSHGHTPQGVLVVTEDTAFVVALHASVALQWGAMDKAKHPLITDCESYDSKAATDAMLRAYEGVVYEDEDDEIWNVEGAPAARWCREYSHGNIGAGSWDLPTLASCKLIIKHRNAINDCIAVMGGWKLPALSLWSSTACVDNDKGAWVVGSHGNVYWYDKGIKYSVRAVSAFRL